MRHKILLNPLDGLKKVEDSMENELLLTVAWLSKGTSFYNILNYRWPEVCFARGSLFWNRWLETKSIWRKLYILPQNPSSVRVRLDLSCW